MRTGVVVALTIPVVVSTTFILMYENGIYLHKVSLGALILALGLLVDDAIIVVEMMSVKLEEGWGHFKAATLLTNQRHSLCYLVRSLPVQASCH